MHIPARQAADYWRGLLQRLGDQSAGRGPLIVILAFYAAAWTLYGSIAKSSQAIHPDMAEIEAWGWNLEWGTPKHPPLLPVVVRAWFSIVPEADWTYYLLAMLCVATGIFFSWLVCSRWLSGNKLAAVPFLLMLVPFYNFHGLRLDHNVILIPLWAMTTYVFVRSFDTRKVIWSVATGLMSGLVLLAKYWSGFLLMGLMLAALLHKDRLKYLRSHAPWVTAAVGTALFLPHLFWLQEHDYPTFQYALHRHARAGYELWSSLVGYFFGGIGYVVLPTVIALLLGARSRWRTTLRDMVWPDDSERRFALALFALPLFVAMPFAAAMHIRLNSLWTMGGLSLFGVVLLSSPLLKLPERSVPIFATLAAGFASLAIVAAPLVAYWKLDHGFENYATYTPTLAENVRKTWASSTNAPLRLIGSSYPIATSTAFYLDNALPISFTATSPARWSNDETIDKFGIALVCPAEDRSCHRFAHKIEQDRKVLTQSIVTVRSQWFGWLGHSQDFVVDVVAPIVDEPTDSQEFCCFSAARRTAAPHPELSFPKRRQSGP